MKHLPFIIFLFLSINGLSQNFSIEEKANLLIIKNKEGKYLDSIWINVGSEKNKIFHYEIKQETIITYHFFRATIPDNCANYLIIKKTYDFSTGKFKAIKSINLNFNNSGCQSYFDEENLYCIQIKDVEIQKVTLILKIVDTKNRKTVIKINLKVFEEIQSLDILKEKLKNFLLTPKCVEIIKGNN
jgi:hypothetical protein